MGFKPTYVEALESEKTKVKQAITTKSDIPVVLPKAAGPEEKPKAEQAPPAEGKRDFDNPLIQDAKRRAKGLQRA